mgnify:CR=1 FL=1
MHPLQVLVLLTIPGRIAHIDETAREIAIGAPAISIIIRITNIIRPDNHAMLMLLLLSL